MPVFAFVRKSSIASPVKEWEESVRSSSCESSVPRLLIRKNMESQWNWLVRAAIQDIAHSDHYSCFDLARVQRALLLIAKLLQSLACNQVPNEAYLQPIYEAGKHLRSSMEKLFRVLVTPISSVRRSSHLQSLLWADRSISQDCWGSSLRLSVFSQAENCSPNCRFHSQKLLHHSNFWARVCCHAGLAGQHYSAHRDYRRIASYSHGHNPKSKFHLAREIGRDSAVG